MKRHDLVTVEAGAWREATAPLDLPSDAARCVADWIRRGRPAMIRRRLASDGDAVPLAIQLPNAFGRLRLAIAAPPGTVTARPPIGLTEAAVAAPPSWRAIVRALLELAEAFGPPSVYGGLLWQHLIGEPVLREGSDLDLLWHPAPDRRSGLVRALAGMDGIPRVDGEIVLEDGGGVSWRELAAARDGRCARVAVKTVESVTLRELRAILGETAPC